MLQRLAETAVDAGAAGKDNYYGWGLLRVGAAATPKPYVSNLTWCTVTAITVPGTCSMTAYLSNGIAPFEVRFEVSYSNQPGVTTHYGWGSATRDIGVPGGSYSLTVKAFPREQVYQRTGSEGVFTIPVCTDGQGLVGGGSTNAPGGCGGGPPEF